MNCGARHDCKSKSRDEGVLSKQAKTLNWNHDGTKLLCGFDCNKQAHEMVKRLKDNGHGEYVEVLIPWCGSC